MRAGGADRLRAAGIAVDIGLEEAAARDLNIGFVARVTRGRPWVRTKLAASLDGRTALANGESQWITGADARADGHAFRARACAILTGVGTVLQDDPQLTVRAVATPRQPRRVIVDRHGQTPASARVLAGDGALIVTAGERNPAWPAQVESLALPDARGRVDLPALLAALAARGVNELHVEAGAKLNGALLDAGLVDEMLLYVAPAVLGDPARGMFERAAPLSSLAARSEFAWHDVQRIGDDLRWSRGGSRDVRRHMSDAATRSVVPAQAGPVSVRDRRRPQRPLGPRLRRHRRGDESSAASRYRRCGKEH